MSAAGPPADGRDGSATTRQPFLILHHYPESPFAEKIRRVLAYRRIGWHAVVVPMVAPKPELVALTGGYRRTPVLQLGADILCDTALIARLLDRMGEAPSLLAGPALQTTALVRWAEQELFTAAMGWCFQPAGAAAFFAGWDDARRDAFLEDRRRLREGGAVLRMNGGDAAAMLARCLAQLSAQLSDGRDWLTGATPSLVDFAVWPSLWTIDRLPPVAGVLDRWPALQAWMARVRAIADPNPIDDCGADAAIAIARTCRPDPAGIAARLAPSVAGAFDGPPAPAFEPGEMLRVMPNDNGFDPVDGLLVHLGDDHVALRREDPRAGEVVVHFPRAGYTLRRSATARGR